MNVSSTAFCNLITGILPTFQSTSAYNSDPKNYSDDDFFDAAYRNYTIERIPARRSINSKATGRGEINELLIRSNHRIRGNVD